VTRFEILEQPNEHGQAEETLCQLQRLGWRTRHASWRAIAECIRPRCSTPCRKQESRPCPSLVLGRSQDNDKRWSARDSFAERIASEQASKGASTACGGTMGCAVGMLQRGIPSLAMGRLNAWFSPCSTSGCGGVNRHVKCAGRSGSGPSSANSLFAPLVFCLFFAPDAPCPTALFWLLFWAGGAYLVQINTDWDISVHRHSC
jgi:hypothetical protein